MTSKTYAHFIGAGGAGMSGIALVLASRGVRVTGSDLKASRYSKALEAAGVPVAIGHDAENLGDPEVVVVSSAIPEKNPELAEARAKGIEVWPRAKMLAHLAEHRKTIAVAGTHGKTSTSSMIAMMLHKMGLDPTFLIGGEVDGPDSNAANGSGEHYVVEADESDGSFVFLEPFAAVITNIEADHMDHYASIDEIVDTFESFMDRTKDDGVLIVCGEDEQLVSLAEKSGRRVVTYGGTEACDVRFHSVVPEGGGSAFVVDGPGFEVASSVSIPGAHMVSNACAAIATAYALGLDGAGAASGLRAFTGVRRRFDHVGTAGGVTVVDDYAHHPTEVAATLEAASGLGYGRVWAVFQPHRYSRTNVFAQDFGRSFADADRIVFMDVYSAGEAPIPGVSGKTLLDATLEAAPRSRVAYLPHRGDVVPYLSGRIRKGDIVLTMGAGDVTALGPEILAQLGDRASEGDVSCS